MAKSRWLFIRNFSPAWFASVMGTGIVAVTSLFYSQYLPFLKALAYFTFYLNVALFFVLLVPWILRWIFFREEALADLEHPVNSNFYATISAGMIVLAVDFIVVGRNMTAGEVFWLIGTIATIFFGVVTPYIMFRGGHIKIDHISPAWFIPPIGLIIIPVPGSFFVNRFSGILREFVIALNYFGWGAGFFLYIALFTIAMYRFILHHPLPSILAPTIWMNIGPIGAGTIALVNLIKSSPFITVKEPFLVFALMFWGFGIWWFIMAIMMTFYYIKRVGLPYAMSWWAFTFPLGAYSAASHIVSEIFGFKLIDYIGFAVYILLLITWTITFAKTLENTLNGTLFRG
ncbi:TDT family transporter [Stetteria hydrogenophila]